MRYAMVVTCVITFGAMTLACSDPMAPEDDRPGQNLPPAVRVSISPAVDTLCTQETSGLLTGGAITQLQATAWDADGRAIPGATFQWSSDNRSAARVSSTGKVTTGNSSGRAMITARSGAAEGHARIEVYNCSFSCPLVYSWDGARWRLDSGTFGGAIMRALQRTDTDNLDRVSPVDGRLRLRVANELSETDHIDALTLLVVDHPTNTGIVPDAEGGLHVIRNPSPPLAAHDFDGNDVLGHVARPDGDAWVSRPRLRDITNSDEVRDGIVLAFARPDGNDAHLVVDANNTEWAAQLLGEWVAARGAGAQAWYDSLNAQPQRARELGSRVAEQAFLQVAVWTGEDWQRQALVWEAGPEIGKRQIVHVDLTHVREDTVLIRLESPPAFWRIDAVTLEAARYADIRIHRIAPDSAIAHDGIDPRARLGAVDGQYLTLETGDWVEMSFADPAQAPGRARSYLIRSTGWYQIHTRGAPTPDIALLRQLEATADGLSRLATMKLNQSIVGTSSR